jgi:hypothetical protein
MSKTALSRSDPSLHVSDWVSTARSQTRTPSKTQISSFEKTCLGRCSRERSHCKLNVEASFPLEGEHGVRPYTNTVLAHKTAPTKLFALQHVNLEPRENVSGTVFSGIFPFHTEFQGVVPARGRIQDSPLHEQNTVQHAYFEARESASTTVFSRGTQSGVRSEQHSLLTSDF